MAKILYPFFLLAAAGFSAMLLIHVASVLGPNYFFSPYMKVILPALFVVWIATIFAMRRLGRDVKQRDLWRAALRGCPAWMRIGVFVVFGYAWLGFFLRPLLSGKSMQDNANGAQSISALVLAFYGVATAVLYSATHIPNIDLNRTCPNGHRVSPFANFCEVCGAPVQASPPIPPVIS